MGAVRSASCWKVSSKDLGGDAKKKEKSKNKQNQKGDSNGRIVQVDTLCLTFNVTSYSPNPRICSNHLAAKFLGPNL